MPDTDLDRAFDDLVAEVEAVLRPPGAGRAVGTLRARRAGVAAAALVVVAAGGAVVAVQDGGAGGPEPAPPVTRTENPSVPPRQVFPVSVVDGHWRTRALAPGQLRTLLDDAGRDGVLARWESEHPAGQARVTLAGTIVNGYGLWLGTTEEPYVHLLDWGYYDVHGDRMRLRHHNTSTPTAILRPVVEGLRLTFEVVATSWPARHGVAGTDQLQALYGELPFTRFVSAGPTG